MIFWSGLDNRPKITYIVCMNNAFLADQVAVHMMEAMVATQRAQLAAMECMLDAAKQALANATMAAAKPTMKSEPAAAVAAAQPVIATAMPAQPTAAAKPEPRDVITDTILRTIKGQPATWSDLCSANRQYARQIIEDKITQLALRGRIEITELPRKGGRPVRYISLPG